MIIGFNLLSQLTGDKKARQAARDHLNQVRDRSKAYRGADHHGRSYNAYGYIRGFEDYRDPGYLLEARQWLEHVALDMSDNGLLQPEGDYWQGLRVKVVRRGMGLVLDPQGFLTDCMRSAQASFTEGGEVTWH